MRGDYILIIPEYVHDLVADVARKEGIVVNEVYRKIFCHGTEGIVRLQEREKIREERFEERIEGDLADLIRR